MKRIRITVIRKVCHRDLIARYENPIEHACDLEEGQVFLTDGWQRPEGLCESAWQTLSPFVMALAHGATQLYDGWMKDPASAMLSCNDGFRPVSFLVEALEEPEESHTDREHPFGVGPAGQSAPSPAGPGAQSPPDSGVAGPAICPDGASGTPDPENNRKQ